jgi:hypothetical protein
MAICAETTHELDYLLQSTLDSFWKGCRYESTSNSFNSSIENILNYKLQVRVQQRLSLTDQLILNWLKDICSQGLSLARCEKFIVTEQLFKEAQILLESRKLSLEGSLLYRSIQAPAEAYLEYRRGDPDKARDLIFKALASDEVLEDKYGYEFQFIHRLHLARNLLRVQTDSRYFSKGIELAKQLLRYFQGTSDTLPIPGSWEHERLIRQSPRFVVDAISIQIVDEIAQVLAGSEELTSILFSDIHLGLTSSYCHLGVIAWLHIKQSFINNDVEAFLKRTSQFLLSGRGNTPILWYATIIDLLILLKEVYPSESRLIRQEITYESLKWNDLPRKFSVLMRTFNESRTVNL